MAVFSNSDIRKRRESLGMSAADLAEKIGCDPTTIYKYEKRIVVPNPDVMYQIAEAFCDLNIWYDWMRTEYPASYGRMHPDWMAHDLPGALMAAFAEMGDLMDMERDVTRDAANGVINDPALRERMVKEMSEALGALQRARNLMVDH